MANITTETSSNIFYQARCAAAKYNERLSSREKVEEIISIDRGKLYRIERGVAIPYPEEIHMMADLYNAPQLRNYYCRNCCILGKDMPEACIEDIDRITIRALVTLRKVSDTKNALLDIMEDGIIDDDEKPVLYEIVKVLDEINEVTASLKNWIKRNINNPVNRTDGIKINRTT